MNEIQQTILEQISWRELKFAKFSISLNTDKGIEIRKGKKAMVIQYNSMDLYDIRKLQISPNYDVKETKLENVYDTMLKEIIQDFFKFEYVMHNFVRR
jgi:hypothetical protein